MNSSFSQTATVYISSPIPENRSSSSFICSCTIPCSVQSSFPFQILHPSFKWVENDCIFHTHLSLTVSKNPAKKNSIQSWKVMFVHNNKCISPLWKNIWSKLQFNFTVKFICLLFYLNKQRWAECSGSSHQTNKCFVISDNTNNFWEVLVL